MHTHFNPFTLHAQHVAAVSNTTLNSILFINFTSATIIGIAEAVCSG